VRLLLELVQERGCGCEAEGRALEWGRQTGLHARAAAYAYTAPRPPRAQGHPATDRGEAEESGRFPWRLPPGVVSYYAGFVGLTTMSISNYKMVNHLLDLVNDLERERVSHQ